MSKVKASRKCTSAMKSQYEELDQIIEEVAGRVRSLGQF